MDSFNVYRQTEKTIGGNTPIWLGTVKPIPVGAYVPANEFQDNNTNIFRAGTPCWLNELNRVVTFVSGIEAANAYLYNDIYSEEGGDATAAVVMHHPEGLLIERAMPDITEEQIQALQAKIPGVLLVRG